MIVMLPVNVCGDFASVGAGAACCAVAQPGTERAAATDMAINDLCIELLPRFEVMRRTSISISYASPIGFAIQWLVRHLEGPRPAIGRTLLGDALNWCARPVIPFLP